KPEAQHSCEYGPCLEVATSRLYVENATVGDYCGPHASEFQVVRVEAIGPSKTQAYFIVATQYPDPLGYSPHDDRERAIDTVRKGVERASEHLKSLQIGRTEKEAA